MKIESIENGVQITVEEKENHTLEDLRQKLINDLYSYNSYDMVEAEIIKVLFENEKKEKVDGISANTTSTIFTKDSITSKVC